MNQLPVDLITKPNQLSPVIVRDMLSGIMNGIGGKVLPYCWKLIGDDPDSLSKLLGLCMEDMHRILLLSGLFMGDVMNMKFKKQRFEYFAQGFDKGHVDWSPYRQTKGTNLITHLKEEGP